MESSVTPRLWAVGAGVALPVFFRELNLEFAIALSTSPDSSLLFA